MKKIFLLLLAFSFSFFTFSQDSLVWKIAAKKVTDATYQITANGTIAKGWHLYANNPTVAGLEESNVKFVFQLDNIKTIDAISAHPQAQTIKDVLFENAAVNVYTNDIELKQTIKINGVVPATIKLGIVGFIAKETELVPLAETQYEVALEGGVAASASNVKLASIDIKNPISQCGDKIEKGSLWTVFLLGLVGGFIALFTPCMFPMIPVTVSFFTKRSPSRKKGIQNGLLYGFFIFAIYALASTPFHLLNLNSEIFNSISTSPTLNIIFFMALTLVIVSFSCTGVILGTLLVGTSSGGAWALTVGMSGFGIALGLPFALFAIFPNWLENLPKSGGWLDTVKKVLAFVEVALALKFLSNADLVSHWGLLKREVFIALWMVICICLALYAFGILRLPHDYKGQKISKGRKSIGVIALLFVLYLAPGLTKTTYANLTLLSGIVPPLSYSVYADEARFKGLEPNVINDYDKALAMAKAQHKPLLIDFTGWACANCRRMEEQVWTNENVAKIIREHFILVSLYVDDKAKLPVDKRIMNYKTIDGNVKDIITVGDRYATFESENFNQVSQPLYAMLDNNEKLLAFPVGATFDAKKYLAWLECGVKGFKQ
jgi:thiol:disulfide interchange protein